MKKANKTMTAALAVVGGLTAAVATTGPAHARCCAGFQRYGGSSEQSGYQGRQETAEEREARLADRRIRREARRLARAEERAAREAAAAEAAATRAGAAPTLLAGNN